jgi:signal transduction histidine kinase
VAVKKGALADMTAMATGILAHYDGLVAAGRMTLAEAQQAAIAHLHEIRFATDNRGYFWINDQRPRLLMHPHRTDLEGRPVASPGSGPRPVRPGDGQRQRHRDG